VKIVLATNLIPPYRHRVYNHLALKAGQAGGGLTIVQSQHHEAQRNWPAYTGRYQKAVLAGISLPLGENRVLRLPFGIKRVLDCLCPDVAIIAGFGPAMWQAHQWCQRHQKPYVLQSDGWAGSERDFDTPLRRLMRRKMISRAGAFLAAGFKGREWFAGMGALEQMIHTAALPPSFDPAALSPVAPQDRPFDLLWCGRTTKAKGIEDFIKIAARLCQDRPKTKVRIVGTLDPIVLEDKLRKAGIAQKCQIEGPRSPDDLGPVYQSARLFLLPSHSDAYGVAIPEAISSGTVVIASDQVGCAHDFLIASDTMLDLENLDAWSAACCKFLDDPDLWQQTRTRQTEALGDISPHAIAGVMWQACLCAHQTPKTVNARIAQKGSRQWA
jgi:glycosyltransferase involved in cell wall biosynthesis